MRTRQSSNHLLYSFIASLLISGIALAADSGPEPSKEMRAQMATVHEQMAACLRSDKSIHECRSEMMNGCQQLMGKAGCRMMGMGMHHQMMQGPGPVAPNDK